MRIPFLLILLDAILAISAAAQSGAEKEWTPPPQTDDRTGQIVVPAKRAR